VVGDQERIDDDLAHALVTRLYAAGFELHQGLRWGTNPDVRAHIESALEEIDAAIRLIRLATVGLDNPKDLPPAP